MKKLILAVLAASALASSLTGCAGGFKSYYALQDECESGVVQSCKDLRSRDRVTGTMAAGMEGYNEQRRLNLAEIKAMQPAMPVTTHCTESPLGLNSMAGSITCTTN